MNYLKAIVVACSTALFLTGLNATAIEQASSGPKPVLEVEFRNRIPEAIRFEVVSSAAGNDHLITYYLDGKEIAKEPVPEKTFKSLVSGLDPLRVAGNFDLGRPCGQTFVMKAGAVETVCLDRVSAEQKAAITRWLHRIQRLLALVR